MFQVTPAAAEQILRAGAAQPEEVALRVAAKIDDDGEFVYGMGFDEERENDLAIECAGVRIVIAPRSQELLDETTLDFVELKPGEFQFVFINPKEPPTPSICVSRTGGCGSCGSGGGCN
jgi:iron-sulfur cluster assembly protein